MIRIDQRMLETLGGTIVALAMMLGGLTATEGLSRQALASMEESPPVSKGHSDADLEVEIESAFVQEPAVSMTGVDVEVRNGVATLTGTVDSEAARAAAAATAMKAGAIGVRNMLQVTAP